MYTEEIKNGIRIVRPDNDTETYYFIENIETGAYFLLDKTIQEEGEYKVLYKDSFDNIMLNNKKLKITFNKDEEIRFGGYRTRVGFSNDISITALPMIDIQEIANKTFYSSHQWPVVDFVELIITEPHRCEFLVHNHFPRILK